MRRVLRGHGGDINPYVRPATPARAVHAEAQAPVRRATGPNCTFRTGVCLQSHLLIMGYGILARATRPCSASKNAGAKRPQGRSVVGPKS